MKNIIYKKMLPTILLLTIFTPFLVMAESYTLMSGEIPGLTSGIIEDTSNPAIFLVSVYWYIFGLGVALAVLMITVGGVQYTLGWTPVGSGDAKGKITNSVIGLVILFTSYLLLYTINKNLVGFNVNLSEQGCNSPLTGNSTVPMGGVYAEGGQGGTGNPTGMWKSSSAVYGDGTDQTIRNKITASKRVTINKNDCPKPGDTDCTSLKGLGVDAVNGIEDLSTQVKGLIVTGGTEAGHGSHSVNNNNVVDLGINKDIDDYVSKNTDRTSQTDVGTAYHLKNGDVFVRETKVPHWHVIFAPKASAEITQGGGTNW